MDQAVLLNKLMNCKDESIELYRFYLYALDMSLEPVDMFNKCINAIKYLVDKQYDFQWIFVNAKQFNVTRKDFKDLCDDVCMILGDRINEICKYSKFPIITKPTNFENYCPFNSDTLVVYGEFTEPVKYEGKIIRTIETKTEKTPYYCIHCTSLDL
jgi:hypothetical protein